MSRSLGLAALGLLAWGATLRGVLALSDLGGEWGHPFCGPWGCAPESIQSLAALQGFWFVLFAPPVIWGIRRLPIHVLHLTGVVLLVAGVLGLLGVGVYEAVTWLPGVYADIRPYFFQRWLLTIVMLTDVPLVQLAVAGLTLGIAGRVRRSRESAIPEPRWARFFPARRRNSTP